MRTDNGGTDRRVGDLPVYARDVERADREHLTQLARRTVREIVATAVGFTVLGVNRVQVERRKMEAARRKGGTERSGRS